MKIGIQEAVMKLTRQDGKCPFCSRPLKNLEPTIDHMTALCRGGKDKSMNRVIACFDCNNRKSFLNASEFRLGLLPVVHEGKKFAQPRVTRKWPYFSQEYAIEL